MRSKTDSGSRRRASEAFNRAYSVFKAASKQTPGQDYLLEAWRACRRRAAVRLMDATILAHERGVLTWQETVFFAREALEAE